MKGDQMGIRVADPTQRELPLSNWTRFNMALNGRNPAARKEVAMEAERHVMRHLRSRQLGEVDGIEQQQERSASSHIQDYRENHALILGACVRRRHENGLAGIAARLAPGD